MQTFASLLRSCALLALFTGSSGQSVPAGTFDELLVEFREFREMSQVRDVEFREFREMSQARDLKLEKVMIELVEVRLDLELLRTQPRRMSNKEDFLSCMREDEISGDIYFEGCNVHVRNGGGSTDAPPNGKGNLIIGYNEPRDSLMEVPESAEGLEDIETKKLDVSRGGSHNLIIGDGHEYTSYGGIVTGLRNGISNKYSAVVGGSGNAATGEFSTVTGGAANEATNYGSFISGGYGNTASGIFSSISGGDSNTASNMASSIFGGHLNTASGQGSSISGGKDNTASGEESSISGGYRNTASGTSSSVLGGRSNVAQGAEAAVTGGLKNKAIGDGASVVGGKKNKALKKFSVVTGA